MKMASYNQMANEKLTIHQTQPQMLEESSDREQNLFSGNMMPMDTLNQVGDRTSRQRLRSEQIAMLEVEYQRNPNWHSSFITSLAQRLQLNRTKVYKWSWDRKKKEEAQTTQQSQSNQAGGPACEEPSYGSDPADSAIDGNNATPEKCDYK